MHKKIIWFTGILLLIIIVILSPIIDNSVAELSYNSKSGSFYGENSLPVKVIYHLVPWLTGFMIIFPISWLVWSKIKHDEKQLQQAKRFSIIILLSLALGPGLLVNTIFKGNWGRARPYQVLRDGKIFTPVWQANLQQKNQRSFSSGHASIGFFLGIPLLALGRRRSAVLASLAGGAVVGCVRILQGGHYVTDVLFSGAFVWVVSLIVIYFTDKWLYKKVSSE
jgi:lipid A 4'-phosphatase